MQDELIIFLASQLHIVIVALAVAFGALSRSKELGCISLIALPLSFTLGRLASTLFVNPRPFVVENIQPLIAHAADNGFPSEHTLLVVTFALLVYTEHRALGGVLLLFGLFVGLGRVIANVHHAVDILGAVAIAVTAVSVSRLLVHRAKGHYERPDHLGA